MSRTIATLPTSLTSLQLNESTLPPTSFLSSSAVEANLAMALPSMFRAAGLASTTWSLAFNTTTPSATPFKMARFFSASLRASRRAWLAMDIPSHASSEVMAITNIAKVFTCSNDIENVTMMANTAISTRNTQAGGMTINSHLTGENQKINERPFANSCGWSENVTIQIMIATRIHPTTPFGMWVERFKNNRIMQVTIIVKLPTKINRES